MQKWPNNLLIVRHAESEFNVARKESMEKGLYKIKCDKPNMLVDLTKEGVLQAKVTGRKIDELYDELDASIISPYKRTMRTNEIMGSEISSEFDDVIDDRIREMEHGAFAQLTRKGRKRYYPEEFKRREREGKFHFRPPGGESCYDVGLRLRGMIDTLTRDYKGQNVMIVTHAAIVVMMRYLLENLSEEHVMEIEGGEDVKNCSVTHYVCSNEKLVLREFNSIFY